MLWDVCDKTGGYIYIYIYVEAMKVVDIFLILPHLNSNTLKPSTSTA